MSLYMVFDVESIGLHGEAFAVGWAVIRDGEIIANSIRACKPKQARGTAADHLWVAANCHIEPNLSTPFEVRQSFWEAWQGWKAEGALLAADVPWPVEARFLAACVDDDPAERTWAGPYPLIDVASVRLAAGLDPLGTEDRLSHELPAHNPEADARQSARLLTESLNTLKASVAPSV